MGLTNIAENGGRGLTGPAGPDIAGLSSDGANGIDVVGNVDAGSISVGGSPLSVAFAGASVDNTMAGQTVPTAVETAASFARTLYDTDSYVSIDPAFAFTVPKDGYYRVAFGAVADGEFAGNWAAILRLGTGFEVQNAMAATSADTVPGIQVVDEAHMTAGQHVLCHLVQVSGSDQLVYPYARISYLGR